MKHINLFYRGWVVICLLILNSNVFGQQLPIKPGRNISFKTDEGSYMNIDVSPDGKTLAFDLLGDLYSIPITGGDATQLTRGLALNLRPVWSPDGKNLAFITDRSGDFHLGILKIADERVTIIGEKDGPLKGYQGNFDPNAYYNHVISWSTDGHCIALGDSMYKASGDKPLSRQPFNNLLRFGKNGSIYEIEKNRIILFDKCAKKLTTVAQTSWKLKRLTISPDGSQLAFITDSNGHRCLINQDLKSGIKKILVPQLIQNDERYGSDAFLPHFCYSPESNSIYISYGGKIHKVNVASGANQIIPFVANVKVDLASLNHNSYAINYSSSPVLFTRSANVSPDNNHIVFSALGKVWITDLSNGKPCLLANQPFNQFQPVFSPDGKWISYVSWCDTTGGELWKVKINEDNPIKMTNSPSQYQRPAWTIDGKSIAVIKGGTVDSYAGGNGLAFLGKRDEPGIGQLQLIGADDSKITAVKDSIPLWNTVSFSSNGQTILFTPLKDRRRPEQLPMLLGKNLQSGIQQVVVKEKQTTASSTIYPTDIYYGQKAVSHDGRFVVFGANEELYLMPLTGTNIVPQLIDNTTKSSNLIRFASGEDPYWKGKTLAWSHGNRFYEIDPDKIVAAAKKVMPQQSFTSVDAVPDETINIKLKVPSSYAHGIIALTHARIITMQGNKVIKDGTLLIKDGRFVAGPTPKGAKVIDLKGKTIMPGIIDMHLHMGVAQDIFPQQYWMFLANLAYGVTTARDPAQDFDGFGYAELLRSGQMIGPRLFTVGSPVDENYVKRATSFDDLDRIVKNRALYGGSEIKQYMLDSRLKRQWLVMACRKEGLNMTNEGAFDPIRQIAMIKDGSTGIEHNPVFGDVYKDMIMLYAKSGTYLTPTLQVSYTQEPGKEYFKQMFWNKPNEKLKRFELDNPGQTKPEPHGTGEETLQTITLAHSEDTVHPSFLTPARIDKRILDAGGKITLGSHGNDEGIGAHNEIWALQMGGFTNMQALRAATLSGAEALGVQKDLGSIEVGKIADLVILNSDPLKDIHNTRDIQYVMKDGILYDGNTLDEVWPVRKKCPVWKTPKVLGNGYINSAATSMKTKGAYEAGEDDSDD